MRERHVIVVLGALTLVLFVGLGVASGSPQVKSPSLDGGGRSKIPGTQYSEIGIKPYCTPGVINELNLQVWGPDSTRKGGDAYSPVHIGNGDPTLNPWHADMPYGYLYRISVPDTYSSDHLSVEIYDADSYNRPDNPPAWPTPYPCPGSHCGSPTPTPSADQYASCTNPAFGTCTSNDARYNTGLKLNAFPSGRPAFWRMDEIREPYTQPISGAYQDSYTTQTQYTLWHFDPRITDPYADPATLSDQGGTYLARYTGRMETSTDLSWYRPAGFDILLRDASGKPIFKKEQDGSLNFYLYVQTLAGSSENNFDLRAGPPDLNSGGCATPCYVNQQYLSGVPDWQDGGARIYAKRTLTLNMDTGPTFPLVLTTVRANQAGQTLGIRHFDQDCSGGCGSSPSMTYQMSSCADPTNWIDVGVGYTAPDNGWAYGSNPDPDQVSVPVENSILYSVIFGSQGECPTTSLRLQQNPSYTQDSTTWEVKVMTRQR